MERSKVIDEVLSIGIPLSDIGVNNWALNKTQSIKAIEELRRENISILGGDVYEMINGSPVSNYDNWYCNREDNESWENFVIRSTEYARRYIEGYKQNNEKEIYFTLVYSEIMA